MGETLQPLFILTCMRSFSSVVSSMLGQHAQLFVMPETNLFISDTLGESVALLSEIRPRSLDGLYRLVGELEFGGQSYDSVNEAKTWIDAREASPSLLLIQDTQNEWWAVSPDCRGCAAPLVDALKSNATRIGLDELCCGQCGTAHGHAIAGCRCAALMVVDEEIYAVAPGLEQE